MLRFAQHDKLRKDFRRAVLVLNCVSTRPIVSAPVVIPEEAGIQFSQGSGPGFRRGDAIWIYQ
jgi:hypothetical protein